MQRLRLRSFEIAGFRSFRKPVTLEFGAAGKEPDEIVVFHGPNGSGKSAAIAAMERLVNLLSRTLTNGWTLHGERIFGPELVLATNDRSMSEPLLLSVSLPRSASRFGVATAHATSGWHMTRSEWTRSPSNWDWSAVRGDLELAIGNPLQRFQSPSAAMHVISSRRRNQQESLAGSPGPLSIVLLDRLYAMRTSTQMADRRRWKSFERVFHRLPSFERTEISVEQRFGGTQFPAMTFVEDDRLRTHDELSSGEQQFIALCANVLLANAPIVAIEEPELSLDRDNQRLFLAVLRDLIRDEVLDQVFIESHSPYFDGPEVLRFGRDADGSSTVQRVAGGNSSAESDALRAKAKERGATQQWVTPEGFTQLPDEMRRKLGIEQGGHVWFLETSHGWQAWREEDLDALFNGPSEKSET